MKLGDIVINGWASNRNPHKVMMYVRKTSRKVFCLTNDGGSIEFYNDKYLKLTTVGKLDLTEWKNRIVRQSMETD